MPSPKSAAPSPIQGSEPRPTANRAPPSTAATATSTGGRPTRSASQPTGNSTSRSTSWASERSAEIPARSRPNSRVPRSGMTNWLTADQARAMITPSANMSRTMGAGGSRRARGGRAVPTPAGRSGASCGVGR